MCSCEIINIHNTLPRLTWHIPDILQETEGESKLINTLVPPGDLGFDRLGKIRPPFLTFQSRLSIPLNGHEIGRYLHFVNNDTLVPRGDLGYDRLDL